MATFALSAIFIFVKTIVAGPLNDFLYKNLKTFTRFVVNNFCVKNVFLILYFVCCYYRMFAFSPYFHCSGVFLKAHDRPLTVKHYLSGCNGEIYCVVNKIKMFPSSVIFNNCANFPLMYFKFLSPVSITLITSLACNT